jgi:DUF971 family protein
MTRPLELVLHDASDRLEIRWDDGSLASLSGPRLRQACRCAACESLRRAGVALPAASVSQLHPIGEMGVQILFDDGHDRGIFPWPYLHQLSKP